MFLKAQSRTKVYEVPVLLLRLRKGLRKPVEISAIIANHNLKSLLQIDLSLWANKVMKCLASLIYMKWILKAHVLLLCCRTTCTITKRAEQQAAEKQQHQMAN